jgi:hypothetical protein
MHWYLPEDTNGDGRVTGEVDGGGLLRKCRGGEEHAEALLATKGERSGRGRNQGNAGRMDEGGTLSLPRPDPYHMPLEKSPNELPVVG